MPLPTRILVPTDFSDDADVALDYASALAIAVGAKLRVLHVIPEKLFGNELDAEEVPELVRRTEREVRHRLQDWSSSADRHELNEGADVATGVPDATILEYVDAHGIDLIVMGGRGHGSHKPPRLGHVAVGVLQKARCPVLVLSAGSAVVPRTDREQ